MSHFVYTNIVTSLFPDAEVKHVVRLTGGVSADIHRLDLQLSDGGTTSVVLRSHGASYSGHSVELEYQLLKMLYKNGLPVPEPMLFDISGSLLADPFLLMQFIDGTDVISSARAGHCIELMADLLLQIHALPITELPTLPARTNPLPELFDYQPEGDEWQDIFGHLQSLTETEYKELPKLLHGDYWPGNLLWRNGSIASVIDWEDAAIGDPLSDVACCRLELRYKFGQEGVQRFTETYAKHRVIDRNRLALWQVYVAAAAQCFMGEWGLDPAQEAYMRAEALASIREAGAILMKRAN